MLKTKLTGTYLSKGSAGYLEQVQKRPFSNFWKRNNFLYKVTTLIKRNQEDHIQVS